MFSRKLNDEMLSFQSNEGTIRDVETQSTWNLLGIATGGAMAGKRLSPMEHGIYFAFAWLAFRPDTEIVRP